MAVTENSQKHRILIIETCRKAMQSAFGVKFVDSKEISEWGGALTFSNNW
jgi:hypothetical protein